MSRRLILAVATWGVLVGTGIGNAGAQAQFFGAGGGQPAGGGRPAAGSQFTLTGVLVVEGGGRAWIQEPGLTQDQVVSLRVGDTIGAYKLTKVLDDRIEMQGPSGPFVVRLAGAGTAAAPAPAPAPVVVRTAPTTAPPPELPPAENHVQVELNMQGAPGPPVDFGTLLRGLTPR